MRLTDNDLRTLRLALDVWVQQESEGATTPQNELDEAEKLWQKITRELHQRRDKESAQ